MRNKSNFKLKVYNLVKQIPKGEVRTYAEIALAIGHPRSYRAVGNVLNKNYSKDIPCHRVVRSDGKTGGYNRGSRLKIKLLREEGVEI